LWELTSGLQNAPFPYGTALALETSVTIPRFVLIGALVSGCLAASAVGGYLAVRSGNAGASAAPATASLESAAPDELASASTMAAAEPVPAQDVTASDDPVPPGSRATEPSVDAGPSPSHAVTRQAAATTPVPAGPEVEAGTDLPEPRVIETRNAAPDPTDVQAFRPAYLPAAAPEPAMRELTIPGDSVIGIRLDTDVSSETSRVEDPVTAHVTRDVLVGDELAIPAGARLEGIVSVVEPGGKFREQARIGIEFTTVVVDDLQLPLRTESVFRTGEPPTGEATSKIGASAVIGTILGAVIGGKKGAAIGGTAGAAGGTAAVMAGDRNPATIAAGTPLTIRLAAPLTVTVVLER
jgi:hypothetical protein